MRRIVILRGDQIIIIGRVDARVPHLVRVPRLVGQQCVVQVGLRAQPVSHPRQVFRQRYEEIIDTPGDDDDVVETEIERDDHAADTDADETWVNLLEALQRGRAKPLTDTVLQNHEGKSFEDHASKERDQKST